MLIKTTKEELEKENFLFLVSRDAFVTQFDFPYHFLDHYNSISSTEKGRDQGLIEFDVKAAGEKINEICGKFLMDLLIVSGRWYIAFQDIKLSSDLQSLVQKIELIGTTPERKKRQKEERRWQELRALAMKEKKEQAQKAELRKLEHQKAVEGAQWLARWYERKRMTAELLQKKKKQKLIGAAVLLMAGTGGILGYQHGDVLKQKLMPYISKHEAAVTNISGAAVAVLLSGLGFFAVNQFNRLLYVIMRKIIGE